jgi:DNA repair exonuclease SbcCD ATPase subunit
MRKKKEKYGEPTFSKNGKANGSYRSKSQHSILHKHKQKLEEFSNKKDNLRALEIKIKQAKRELDTTDSTKTYKMETLASEIVSLERERENIESGQEEINYLLNSSGIVMKYMDLDEKERQLLNVSNCDENQTRLLNEIATKKNDLTDDYLLLCDPKYVSMRHAYTSQGTLCDQCNEYLELDSGFLVCPSCGVCMHTIESNADLSFKEMQTYDYRPQFTYDKMTHLDDWLRRFQAKENRTMPQEVLDKVVLEARKERLRDLNGLTEEKVKRYLKKLSLNEYYDNVIGIINRINGRPPFTLTSEIEDKIKTMFQQIQEPFEKYKPPNRRNFLSYSYTLHKFFQILGLHEFSKYFPLLKSPDKLRQQDDIFKKVVAEMAQKDKTVNWVFYPSI